MAGVLLILLGVFKLGAVIKFIPYPIIVGFTSGIAVTIFTTQIKDLFGLTTPEMPGDFAGKWMVYFQNFGTIDLWATAVGNLLLWIGPLIYNAYPIWVAWTVFFSVCIISMGVMLGMVKWLERVTE